MQSHGITLSFHREMADSARELGGLMLALPLVLRVIHASSKALQGCQDQKIHCRFQACSLSTIEIARNNAFCSLPQQVVEFLELIELRAIIPNRGHRMSPERSNQVQEFLLLWSVASCNQEGSDLNVGHLAARGD